MATASTAGDRRPTSRLRSRDAKRPRKVALAPCPPKPAAPRHVLPVRRRRVADASTDRRDAHARGNEMPSVLRVRSARDLDAPPVPTDRLTCCVYCDDAMFANALLAVGSFRRFAPGARLVLFVRDAARYGWLRQHVELVEAEDALRAVNIGVDDFSR